MPTLPIAGHQDLQFSAVFREKFHADLGMVANFVNPRVPQNLPMSASFRARGNASLPQYGTFKTPKNLPFTATFVNPKSIVSLPMSAHFYNLVGHSDLLSNAIFHVKAQLPMSVIFRHQTVANLNLTATFKRKRDLRMSANFVARGQKDLGMSAVLGKYNASVLMSAIMYQFAHTDFPATINIAAYVPPQKVLYSANRDFPAQILVRQRANSDLVSSATFRRPANTNWAMHAWFGIRANANFGLGATFRQKTNGDLPMSSTFFAADRADFQASITINNPTFGVGGVTVSAGPGNPQAHALNTATSDATGFFEINNLTPGTYLVTPVKAGITFTPAQIPVTLVNSNVDLIFYSDGTLDEETILAPNIPGGCVISQTPGNAGTLSIYGYILNGTTMTSTPVLLTVASNDADIAKFLNTLE